MCYFNVLFHVGIDNVPWESLFLVGVVNPVLWSQVFLVIICCVWLLAGCVYVVVIGGAVCMLREG